jgi:TPP-dependent pyruvate/acetoin dehydrogenase alpha subunit
VISHEKMIALYSAMVKYRMLAAHTQGKIPKSLQLTPGLEATVAAINADLGHKDTFLATESKLAGAFVGRSRWKDLFDAPVIKSAHTRNSHILSSALAKEFASALEAARALKTSKDDAVALVFCETRMKADLWRKYLQRAGRNNLPIVLVRLASDTRRAHVAPGALAFGVPRIAVDANDVLAVYRVASESIARARHRRGPTLIECLIAKPAAGIPDPDPIQAMELVLTKKRILNTALKQKIESGIERELNRVLRPLMY